MGSPPMASIPNGEAMRNSLAVNLTGGGGTAGRRGPGCYCVASWCPASGTPIATAATAAAAASTNGQRAEAKAKRLWAGLRPFGPLPAPRRLPAVPSRPADGVTMCARAREPGERLVSQPVARDVHFERVVGARETAQERLFDDALEGNPARCARQHALSRPSGSSSRCSTCPA
jgi:hypothetical protein